MRSLVEDHNVLVIAHADGDGHIAGEQSRRNCINWGASKCEVYVDPKTTSGYRFWEKYLANFQIGDAQVVIFVDLMLRPQTPNISLFALTEFCEVNSDCLFIMIDHHPIGGLPAVPANLQIWFTSTVYTCCFGPPSELMLVASICDKDAEPVNGLLKTVHHLRALGVSRAAADRSGLAGSGLLQLLAHDKWDLLESLGEEDPMLHRTAWGNRLTRLPVSDALIAARSTANELT